MTEKKNPLEEEFSRLGFNYKRMLETAFYARRKYALFMDRIRLNVNRAKQSHDEIHFNFGVECTAKMQPQSIRDMTVTLVRYSAHSYEGEELHMAYYYPDKGPFPTKDQVCVEMQKILQTREIKDRFSIGDHPSMEAQKDQNAGRKPKL